MSRTWSILDWNLRGINSQERCDEIKEKVDESNCGIMCFQETKREVFDHMFIRKFCPKRFNNFAYTPSVGSSGGIITIWNGNMFKGTVIDQSKYHVTVEFVCNFSGFKWSLSNIYGPAHNENKNEFLNWFMDIDSSAYPYWMIMGDFNLI